MYAYPEEDFDDDLDEYETRTARRFNLSRQPISLSENEINPQVEMSSNIGESFLVRADQKLVPQEKKLEEEKKLRLEELDSELFPKDDVNLNLEVERRRFRMPDLRIISGLRYIDTKIDNLYELPINNVVTKIWPVACLGILVHDMIYFTYQDLRYQTTAMNLFFGLPKKANLGTVLNHLGSDLIVEPAAYWAVTLGFLGLSIAGAAAGKYIKACTPNIDTTRFPESFKSKPFSYVSRIYSIYAYYRLIAVLIEKIINAVNLKQAETNCNNENNVFTYIDAWAEYQCTVCGDWANMENHLRDMYSGQSCVDILLKSTSEPQTILDKIQRIAKRSDITAFDFGSFDLTRWSSEDFNLLLNLISNNSRKLDLVNFGSKTFNYNSFQKEMLNSILDFLKKNNVTEFNISNQNLSESAEQFILGLTNTTILRLSAENCKLSSAVRLFRQVLPTTSLQRLNIARNEINDIDYCELWNGVAGSDIANISISSNQLGDKSLTCMQNINNTKLSFLDFSSMSQSSITSKGLTLFGRSAVNASLTSLNLSNDGLDDEEFLAIATYFSQWLLLGLDLSDNFLQDSYVARKLFSNLPVSITELKLNNLGMDNDGLISLGEYLLRSQVRILQMMGNNADFIGWKTVINSLLRSKVRTLVAANNFLDTDTIEYLNTALQNSTQSQLNHLDLSNNPFIRPGALINLLDVCAETLVTELMLSYTNADNVFARRLISIVSSTNVFKMIDVSNTYITSDQVVNIITSSRSLKSFIAKGPEMILNDADIFTIATNLIKIDDDRDFLKYKYLNEDEKNWLATHSQPVNPLQSLSITLNMWKGIGSIALTEVNSLTYLTDLSIDYTNGTNDVAPYQYNNNHTPALVLETLGTLLLFAILLSMLNPIYKTCKYAKQKFFHHPNSDYEHMNNNENDDAEEKDNNHSFQQFS